MSNGESTHLNSAGKATMVDIEKKEVTSRTAISTGRITVSPKLLELLRENGLKKGDAFAAARIAGILAAKETDRLIPLSHSIPLSKVSIDLKIDNDPPSITIKATAKTSYKTGVEMEALTAVSVAALTIYDMGKSVDKEMIIGQIRLENKSGGKSGVWARSKDNIDSAT
ncbi:MAG: cyclic pyranopterin monophosphate synthase MoaC [Planctomycetota bacterium]|jgi:cyclic pyranopterin phosphate synthase